MERHFTVSGFLVEGGRTILHWHKKLQLWLPPGGHIDPDEDPVEAVVREVREETGIAAEVVPHVHPSPFAEPPQLPPPLAIIVADVPQGPHQHIDMSYALRPLPGVPPCEPDGDHGFIWVSEAELRRNDALPVAACGVDIAVPEDVRVLGLKAIVVLRLAELEDLIWQWDPIGVAGADRAFVSDEYDDVLRFVLSWLREGLNREALAAALIKMCREHLGLPEQQGSADFAERAVDWFEKHGRPGAYRS